MEEIPPTKRSFIASSEEEYSHFRELLDKSGYKFEEAPRKNNWKSDYINFKGIWEEGTLIYFAGRHVFNIRIGTGLETLAMKFVSLYKSREEDRRKRAEIQGHVNPDDIKEIAGAEQ